MAKKKSRDALKLIFSLIYTSVKNIARCMHILSENVCDIHVPYENSSIQQRIFLTLLAPMRDRNLNNIVYTVILNAKTIFYHKRLDF